MVSQRDLRTGNVDCGETSGVAVGSMAVSAIPATQPIMSKHNSKDCPGELKTRDWETWHQTAGLENVRTYWL